MTCHGKILKLKKQNTMTKKEITQSIEQFKKDHLETIKEMMYNNGELLPIISVLSYDLKTEKSGVIIAPIIGKFDDDVKDFLANKLIPSLFKQLKETNIKPICFSFSSEVWIRRAPEGMKELPENWKDLDKVEALMTTFETEEYSDIHLNTMHRVGKVINSEGTLVDQIELKEHELNKDKTTKVSGRFADIFKRFAS